MFFEYSVVHKFINHYSLVLNDNFKLLILTIFALTDCRVFPSIKNGVKRLISKAAINLAYQTEVTVKYNCDDGYFYTLDNPTVSCTENGFDNKIGKCVKGNMFLILKKSA